MIRITTTELEQNLDYYLDLSMNEDVHVFDNGKVVSVLCNPKKHAFNCFMSFDGCLSEYKNINIDSVIEEEIIKRNGY